MSSTPQPGPACTPASAAPWGAAGAAPSSLRAPAGSAEARVRAMVDAHFDFIWRSLRRLGVPAGDVDDCAQQVFLVASQRLGDIAIGSERSFLFGTAIRVAQGARRTRTRRREVPLDPTVDGEPGGEDDLGEPDPALSPEELAERRRARALLDEVLEQMSTDLRVVFVLFELEEMPTPEIAELLGIPTGTAASRLRRAREEFERVVARVLARARGGKP